MQPVRASPAGVSLVFVRRFRPDPRGFFRSQWTGGTPEILLILLLVSWSGVSISCWSFTLVKGGSSWSPCAEPLGIFLGRDPRTTMGAPTSCPVFSHHFANLTFVLISGCYLSQCALQPVPHCTCKVHTFGLFFDCFLAVPACCWRPAEVVKCSSLSATDSAVVSGSWSWSSQLGSSLGLMRPTPVVSILDYRAEQDSNGLRRRSLGLTWKCVSVTEALLCPFLVQPT